MSGGAGRARPAGAAGVVLPAAGLAVWGTHFGAIYAINALACERGLTGMHVLGLPLVPALILAATALALAALVPLVRPAFRHGAPDATEGGETEPRFTRWFAAGSSVYAALAILFQAAPALVLPGC
ncbi:MAG TPA: hypothetical protein VD970_07070 [Acetobacteraceae bacterium]|nr:hypothetical protein [Acetobacteraceae bacterium]